MSLRSSRYLCPASLLALLSIGCPGPEPSLDADGTGGADPAVTSTGIGPGGTVSGSVVASSSAESGTSSSATSSGSGAGGAAQSGPGGFGGAGGDGGEGGFGGFGAGGEGGQNCDLGSVEHCGKCNHKCWVGDNELDTECRIDGDNVERCFPECLPGFADLVIDDPFGMLEDDGCESDARRVFVTEDEVDARFNSEVGGVAAADALCQAAAQGAGLGDSNWIAWVSTVDEGGTSPIDRLDSPDPYVVVGGSGVDSIVAEDSAALVDGILRPINVTEDTVIVDVDVWTGTDQEGVPTDDTCEDWTSVANESLGTLGRSSAMNEAWTNDVSSRLDCSDRAHVYCFEN